jgi:hypothetical protein
MPSNTVKKNKKTTPKKKMNLGGSATKRNYANERKYDSQPIVKKKRVLRNAARNKLLKAGVVKKYDGKDVHHVGGNALNPNSTLKLYRLVRIGLTLEQKVQENYIELHRRIFKMAKKMTKKEFDEYLDKTGNITMLTLEFYELRKDRSFNIINYNWYT